MNAPASGTPWSARPRPLVSAWAQPFWDAAREERLLLQHCAACQRWIFYPRIQCPHCGAGEPRWRQASGRGTVYSYTVVYNNAPSAFIAEVPYVVAVIRLEEGVQMLSNIVDCDFGALRCDLPVEVTFRVLDERFTLPVFRPRRAEAGQ
jgi:uncharacterized OB-fold protein